MALIEFEAAKQAKKLTEEVELWKKRATELYWEQEMLRQEIARRPDVHELQRLALHAIKLTKLLDFYVEEDWRKDLDVAEPPILRLVM